MKKLSIFTVALALTIFVSCKEKNDDGDMMDENMEEQVDSNASDEMSNADNGDTEELTTEEELFAVDLDE